MQVALFIARLFLALVFGIAGIAKAADKAGSRRAIIDFGVPKRLATLVAWCLPLAEILVAVALIPQSTAWWGACGALALLLSFTIGIGVSLARGQAPDCRCFGQIHSEPVSRVTFGRNLLLVAVAGFVIVRGKDDPGFSALDWLNDLKTGEVITLILAIFISGLLVWICVLLSRLLKQQAEIIGDIESIRAVLSEDGEVLPVEHKEATLPQEGLPVGAMAPKFTLATTGGDKMSLDDLLEPGKFVLLLFAGPNCWGCKVLLPMVRAWERDYSDRLTICILSNGNLDESQDKMTRYEVSYLLMDERSKVADEYQAKWTPAAVLIHPDGRIASQNTYGDDPIREWFRDLIASGQLSLGSANGKSASGQIPQISTRYSVRNIGEPAPKFSLPDLSGRVVDVADLFGSPMLLIFWHPLCEFCAAMLDDLKVWEASPPAGSPKLVLIASGEVEDTKTLNEDFKSLTLLDPAFEIGPLFGTKYTPSAILIDGEGRVASSLAIGDPNVRALVGLRKAEVQMTGQR
ncbi:MAG: MauE/DoxX family redox-associated membrane protein [Blastocatellia bacterium]